MVHHVTMTPTSPEDFARALGATIEYVEPNGQCAKFFEDERRLVLCRTICPGRRRVVMDKLVARL